MKLFSSANNMVSSEDFSPQMTGVRESPVKSANITGEFCGVTSDVLKADRL